ncbi:MAG TPA: ATP-dependent DNA helicase [bacterium]|nr:ATP-dependent DNA helicase [bacterium]
MQDFLDKLNEAQKKAVTHESGPLLIVAGAGTGKTTVLTQRYLWLLNGKKHQTDELVALTFTEKAAQEMEDRVLENMPNGAYDFWIHTFHGFCQRILERHGLEIGIPNTFKILTETDAWILLKKHLEDLPLDYYRPLGNPVKFLHALIRHISRAKDEGITAEQYLDFAQNAVLDGDSAEVVESERLRLKELAEAYAAYQKILRDYGFLDFGDVIMETLRLFKERPAVLSLYQKQFKYLLVDEFQDTNWAQYELIKLLSRLARNVTVVGDDDQAIYKFRGASLANILQFKDDYPEAVTVALTSNYRSHQDILDTAYKVILNNNPHRLEVSLADQGLSKRLKSHIQDEADVRVEWFPTLVKEAGWVADDIAVRHGAAPKDQGWSKYAVLVRSNDQAVPFVEALSARNIPFRFFALRGLYSKPVIVDIMAVLKLAVKPEDSAAAWRVISLQSLKIPLPALHEVVTYSTRKGLSLWNALRQSPVYLKEDEASAKAVLNLVSIISRLSESARREPPLAVLHKAIEETGYLNHIMSFSERERVENIGYLNEFVNRIKRFESNNHAPNLVDFINELEMEIESGEQGSLKSEVEGGPDVVRVMTIHASKGLEFETVYLVSMVDQRFPTRERHDAIPLPDGLVQERFQAGDVHLQEERRLCYVALTRAKKHLILTGADDYGGARKKKPSIFIHETGLDVPQSVNSKEEADVSTLKTLEQQEEAAVLREIFKLKRRFSFTQLVAYKNCPLQYKFAHVYRIPVLGRHQKSFGQSVHLALQRILKNHQDRTGVKQVSLFAPADDLSKKTESGFTVSEDEALSVYKESWIDEWYPTREMHDEYFLEGREAVKRLVQAWHRKAPAVKALEADFDWRIGEHSIKGKIDRLDTLGDGVAIYDYKTGEYKPGQKAAPVDKKQLHLYQLAMEAKGIKVNRLAYLFVRSDLEADEHGCSSLEVPLLEKEAKLDFEEDLKNRMDEILLSEFPAAPSSFLCAYCDFKNICEFRK